MILAFTASAQEAPYAAIDRETIGYAGPGRELSHDLSGAAVRIGLLVPMRGPRKGEGEALLAAAKLALEDELKIPLPDGRHLELVSRDESGLWGRASSEIVSLVVEDRAVAILTSPDGAAAHLAEQIGNRLGIPVVTLSSDGTTTRINIPWLFRVAPSDAAQAAAFAEDIYRGRDLREVLVLVEADRDGRIGGEAFAKAARALGAPAPQIIPMPPAHEPLSAVLGELRARQPHAIVLWTAASTAARFISEAGGEMPRTHLYLSQKATQVPLDEVDPWEKFAGVWVAVTLPCEDPGTPREFDARYCAQADVPPGLPAAAVYDAVRLVAAALRKAGPNRARVRDALAGTRDFAGASGTITFDGAGNNVAATMLVLWRKLDVGRAQR